VAKWDYREAVGELKRHHAKKVNRFYNIVMVVILLLQTILTQTFWENVIR